MLVEGIEARRVATGRVRWSARAGGELLFFEVDESSGTRHSNPADSFAAMGLAVAMLRGEPLHVTGATVSPLLARNLERIQVIWHALNPRYRLVPMEFDTSPGDTPADDVGCLYAAGLDSMYTLLAEADITACIMICGFDMTMDERAVMRSFDRNRAMLDRRGKQLRLVVSNQLTWGREMRLLRVFCYTAYLAAAAFFFAPRKLYLASAYPHSMPTLDGSMPYLDPLWSNGTTEVVHSGAEVGRAAKLERVADDPDLLDHLRVCFTDQNENCGMCEKCVRTMIGLRVLGKRGPFPHVVTERAIRRLRIATHSHLYFATENLMLAFRRGDATTLAALKAALRRYDRKQAIRAFDRGVLGGALRRFRRRWLPPEGERFPGFPEERPDKDV